MEALFFCENWHCTGLLICYNIAAYFCFPEVVIMQHLQICMFGGFSLQAGDTVVTDSGNRARKVWLLLAALLCHRGHVLSPKRLIELTWGDASSITNPENTLRITLFLAVMATRMLFTFRLYSNHSAAKSLEQLKA